jgi:hypothetical protein
LIVSKIYRFNILKNLENRIEKGAGKDTEAAARVKKLGYRGNRYRPAAVCEPKPEQKFQGKCDNLKGFVYDCSDGKQSDRFNLGTKEIAECVGREYQYGGNIRWTIENLERFKEEEPKELDTTATGVQKRMWERRVDEYIKRENKLRENCRTAYSLVTGQRTEHMRAKLEAAPGFNELKSKFDLIGLVKTIKGLSFQFEGQQSKTRSLTLAHKRFQHLMQTRYTTNVGFLEQFLTSVSILDQYGGTIRKDEGAIEDEIVAAGYTAPASVAEREASSNTAREKFLAMSFLYAVDKFRYGKLLDELENEFTKGVDHYPDTLNKAYTLSVNFKCQQRQVGRLFND